MGLRIMGVYDVDPVYTDRFADFVNQRERIPFTVMAFTSLERLKAYSKDHPLEILLIHSGVPREELEEIRAEQVITLTEGEAVGVEGGYPGIYKYQSTDSIVREVMACYCERPESGAPPSCGPRASIVGVYSPVGRCLKTSFALTMGQLLSRDGSALYINFEDFSGLGLLTGASCQEDLSDVLYYFREGHFHWARLKSVVQSWGELDYIPPARYPEDLCQADGEELGRLVRQIAAESGYQALVLDLGQLGGRSVDLLEVCDAVYMPVKEDTISAAKLGEFDQYLEGSGRESLRERIHRVRLPYHNSFGRKETYLEQLLWGELGDYVRQLLKGTRMPWEK